jgi:hypothetical protein
MRPLVVGASVRFFPLRFAEGRQFEHPTIIAPVVVGNVQIGRQGIPRYDVSPIAGLLDTSGIIIVGSPIRALPFDGRLGVEERTKESDEEQSGKFHIRKHLSVNAKN